MRDWCASHPNGTKGQFNYFWATLDQKSTKVHFFSPSLPNTLKFALTH